jgi:hypothetical protein
MKKLSVILMTITLSASSVGLSMDRKLASNAVRIVTPVLLMGKIAAHGCPPGYYSDGYFNCIERTSSPADWGALLFIAVVVPLAYCLEKCCTRYDIWRLRREERP